MYTELLANIAILVLSGFVGFAVIFGAVYLAVKVANRDTRP